MANKLYEETNIQAIANAIRAKGQTGTMTVAQMPSKISAITTKQDVTWHNCPAAVQLFLDEIEYTGDLTLIWTPTFTTQGTTTWSTSDSSKATVSAIDNNSATVTGLAWARGTTVGHVSIYATRGAETKELKARLDNNPEYSEHTILSCVGRTYAPSYAVTANSKPVAITVDGESFRNEIPLVQTPFATNNMAGTLEPLDKLRWMNTTLASGTYYLLGNNARDLGGWECDGGTVKYGMIIRGGEINPADKSLMVGEIGVRTEVSLLPTSKQQYTESPWNIDYVANPTDIDIMYKIDNAVVPQWKLYLSTIFDSVAHAKPVYFHCGVGADKTGTVACVLLAILGVSLSDIQKDYELTSFSPNTTEGGLRVGRERYMYISRLIDRIKAVSLFPGLQDTFRDHAISFALSCGITIAQINAFRDACIDGSPTPIIIGLTITNSLTHCSSSNSAIAINYGDSYSATITADSGFNMSSISVTMGEIDVTAQYVSGYTINIPAVTGNLAITASASIHQSHNILDDYGYFNDTRISLSSPSAWKRASSTGQCATGPIPIQSGDVIRCQGFTFSGGNNLVLCLFKSSDGVTGANGKNGMTPGNTYDLKGNTISISSENILTVTINNNDYSYMEFSGVCADGASAFVTKNEPLPGG